MQKTIPRGGATSWNQHFPVKTNAKVNSKSRRRLLESTFFLRKPMQTVNSKSRRCLVQSTSSWENQCKNQLQGWAPPLGINIFLRKPMRSHWNSTETVLEPYWNIFNSIGTALKQYWSSTGTVLKQYWNSSTGAVLEQYGTNTETVLEQLSAREPLQNLWKESWQPTRKKTEPYTCASTCANAFQVGGSNLKMLVVAPNVFLWTCAFSRLCHQPPIQEKDSCNRSFCSTLILKGWMSIGTALK